MRRGEPGAGGGRAARPVGRPARGDQEVPRADRSGLRAGCGSRRRVVAMGLPVGVYIGGTFTDTVVMSEAGEVSSYKTPTTPESLLDGLLANLADPAADRGLSPARLLADAAERPV